MSDIRFNTWLHQSGTGGITQVDGGHVGIGTTNPDIAVHTANAKKVNVGIVTANSVYAGNFYGDGSNLTGTGHVDKIIEGDTKVEAVDAGSAYIVGEVNGSEKIRITSSGQIAAGTQAIASGSVTGGLALIMSKSDGARIKLCRDASGVGNSDGFELVMANDDKAYIWNRESADMLFGTGGTERLRIGSSGQIGLSGANYGSSGQVLTSQGSGSAPTWTTISGTTINGNTDNYVVTATGTANTLQGEAGLKFDGSGRLILNNAAVGSNEYLTIGPNGSTECAMAFRLNNDNDSRIKFYDNTGTLRGTFGYTTYANSSTYPNFHDSFYLTTDPGSNGTLSTALRISNSGQFIKPLTYKFLVETNGQSVSGGWNKLTGLSIDSNYSTGVSNGSYWSNSNQRFTAPVSGTYLFFIGGFSSTAEGGGTNHRYMYVFQVNGSGLKYGFGGNYSDNNTPMAGGAMHIPLNVNDYVEVQYYTAISATWGAGHRFFWGGYFLG